MSQQQPDPTRDYIIVNCTDGLGFFMGEQILYVHSPAVCSGQDRPCCIHRPSRHHMRQWPQLWRQDARVMERTCPHGVGHPDPDSLNIYGDGNSRGDHTCDGCCNPPTPEVG